MKPGAFEYGAFEILPEGSACSRPIPRPSSSPAGQSRMPALAFPLGDAEHTGRSAAGPGLDDIAAPGWALWCGRGAITGWVRTDQAVPSAFGLDAAGNFLSRRLTARRCSRPSPFRAAASSCWRRNHSLPAGRARNRRNNARTDAQELARPKIFDPRIASAPFVAVLLSDLRPARSDHQPGSPWPQRHGVTRAHASRNHHAIAVRQRRRASTAKRLRRANKDVRETPLLFQSCTGAERNAAQWVVGNRNRQPGGVSQHSVKVV